ncbi:MAG TPA: hypothetical protein VMT63_07895 [Bacteroidales bacterium]|nr:hypothetical protein [Bacteroidales bacterium]
METRLVWKTKSFGNCYEIFSKGELTGVLRTNQWGQHPTGQIDNISLKFITKGLLNQKTEIINSADNKILGMISYNYQKSKGEIKIGEKSVFWKWENFWKNELFIHDHTGTIIKYAISQGIGEITFKEYSGLLILSGMQIINMHRQLSASALLV